MVQPVTDSSLRAAHASTPPCLLKLRAILPALPPQHARIAHFIMLNPADFLGRDAREIGYLCSTSEATVVRFCQRIGYRGLSEMKRVLGRELAANLLPPQSQGKPSRDRSVFDQVFSHCVEAIRDTSSSVDRARFDAIAGAIARSERLYLFGAGGSAHIAQVAALNFLALGFHTVAFVDPIQQLAVAKLATARDVAIAVTYSGNQKDVAEALRTARKKRAFCVAITSFQQSLISEHAQELIMMSIPPETLRGQGGAHRVAQIALLDALAVCARKLKATPVIAKKVDSSVGEQAGS